MTTTTLVTFKLTILTITISTSNFYLELMEETYLYPKLFPPRIMRADTSILKD